jgi:hypothetical protein
MPFDAINDLERYEGMLVRFPQELVISEYFNYDRFGEMVLALPLDGESRPFTGTAIDEPGIPANERTAKLPVSTCLTTLRRLTPVHPSADPRRTRNAVALIHQKNLCASAPRSSQPWLPWMQTWSA